MVTALGFLAEAIDQAKPVIESLANALDLADDQLDVRQVVDLAPSMVPLRDQRSHPQEGGLIHREEIAVCVHPEQSMLQRGRVGRLFHRVSFGRLP